MTDIPYRPQVRKDLIIVKQKQNRDDIYIIKDPISGRYFKVGEDEYSLLQLLDGSRTIEDLLASLGADSGFDLEEIRGFVNTLNENFFLESKRPEPKSRRLIEKSSLFHIRMKIINPQKIVDFLEKHLGFLVSVPSLIIACAITLFAVWLTVSQFGLFLGGIDKIKGPGYILLFYLTVSAIMTIHEFAHAVTCRHFKGEVTEIGFMLLYFIPCFYTDVSDIYLMKKKSQRIAVIVAGPLVELTLWGVFTTLYFFLPKESTISDIFYIVMLTSGLKSILVNFNPMIKFDGYYLLEEILGVHNLMERSREIVSDAKGSLWRNSRERGHDDVINRNEKNKIFLFYAIISYCYTICLIIATFFFMAVLLNKYIGSWSYIVFAPVILLLLLFGFRYNVAK